MLGLGGRRSEMGEWAREKLLEQGCYRWWTARRRNQYRKKESPSVREDVLAGQTAEATRALKEQRSAIEVYYPKLRYYPR